MLKKYNTFFKKQFKYRQTRPSYYWLDYIYESVWFLRTPKILYFRGYVRSASFLKLHFYRLLFKFIKKKFKKRKIWFFTSCHVNRMVTQKQKNARMGKGVGKKTRWLFYFEPYYPVFIVYNCNLSRLMWVRWFLWQHTKLKVFWVPSYISLSQQNLTHITK